MKTKIKNRLFLRVFKTIFFNLVIIFSSFGIYAFFSKQQTLIQNLENEAENVAKSIILASSDALVLNDLVFIFEYNFKYVNEHETIDNLTITAKGIDGYLYIEKNKWEIKEQIDSTLLSMQKNKANCKLISSKKSGEQIFQYAYPIRLSNLKWGWIHIGLDTHNYTANIKKLYFEYGVLFLAILLISFVCSYIIANFITKPILLLNNASKKIMEGDLTSKVHVDSHDEIGELAITFNNMVYSLDQSKKELVSVNKNLEKNVILRTSQLKRANKKLQELNESLDSKVKYEISKREEQEQMLIHQSRLAAMGEMINMIAHQWRQPLNGLGIIIQNIQLHFENRVLTQKDLEYYVEQSTNVIQKMSTTIDDFRDFFNPKKKFTDIILYKLMESTYSLLQASFTAHSIDVIIKPSDIKLYTCNNELSQVIMNILTNAKDAFIENKISQRSITINIYKKNQKVFIDIEDNAGGIPKKIQNKIFDPYFSTKEKKNGTGLGLYLSKVIVESKLNGELLMTPLEKGTRFTIVL